MVVLGVHELIFGVLVLLFSTASGIALLAFVHGGFPAGVVNYLTRRENNTLRRNELPPKCAVTTALLIPLRVTANGKQDLMEKVPEMDTHEWVRETSDAPEERRARERLRKKIEGTLKKVVGNKAVDRKLMIKPFADPNDIHKCMTRCFAK